MFSSNDSKLFSACVLFHKESIQTQFGNILRNALENSTGEVEFLKILTDKFSAGSAIKLPHEAGLKVQTWAKMIHQRPYVQLSGGGGPELGDLLVSVRYELPGGQIDEKSIIYQVKLEKTQNSSAWSIAHNQLNLLTQWPAFNLVGYNDTYNITPWTKEASSYLLLRKPRPGNPNPISTHAAQNFLDALGGSLHNYGVAVSAIDLAAVVDSMQDDGFVSYDPARAKDGSSTATQQSICNQMALDWRAFAEHVWFERGESHAHNLEFKKLIEQVFSFVGSQPVATDFSHGYFCAIQITVRRGQ